MPKGRIIIIMSAILELPIIQAITGRIQDPLRIISALESPERVTACMDEARTNLQIFRNFIECMVFLQAKVTSFSNLEDDTDHCRGQPHLQFHILLILHYLDFDGNL